MSKLGFDTQRQTPGKFRRKIDDLRGALRHFMMKSREHALAMLNFNSGLALNRQGSKAEVR